jgi:hypothetical protein
MEDRGRARTQYAWTNRKEKKMVKQLKSPELVSWLAYLYAPILRYLKTIKIVREGLRDHNPQDILVPEGYTAEGGGYRIQYTSALYVR